MKLPSLTAKLFIYFLGIKLGFYVAGTMFLYVTQTQAKQRQPGNEKKAKFVRIGFRSACFAITFDRYIARPLLLFILSVQV